MPVAVGDGTTDSLSGFMISVQSCINYVMSLIASITTLLDDIMWLLSVNCQIILFSVSQSNIFQQPNRNLLFTHMYLLLLLHLCPLLGHAVRRYSGSAK